MTLPVECNKRSLAYVGGRCALTGNMGSMESVQEQTKRNKAGRPSRHDGAKQAELVKRRALVAELRLQHKTFRTIQREIGPEFGDDDGYISLQVVWNDFQEYLKSLDPPPDRSARQADIREQLWEMVEQAKADEVAAREDGSLGLADKCAARLMGLLAHLRRLDGLDEPARVDVTSQGGPVVGPLDRLAGILGE